MRSRHFVADTFWIGVERATYYIFFPALLVTSLARARLDGLPVGQMMMTDGIGVLGIAALVALAAPGLARPPFRLDGPSFTSLFQCSIRPNTYVGLAAAAGLWGRDGVTLTAIGIALVVPLVNLLCIPAMLHWARPPGGMAPRWRHMLKPIVTNPLIASCLLGVALNVSGIGIPPLAGPFLDSLAAVSLPLGLLAVGAGLSLRALRATGASVLLAVAVKMVALPLLTLAVGRMLGLDGLALNACVFYAALPAAPVSYILARQMGGDAPLVSSMLSVQVVAGAILLPLWMLVLN
ncbi:Permease [Candidatus Terasakiella magnetica]|nr:Permease [Candidatus Terasakiella magnetica]